MAENENPMNGATEPAPSEPLEKIELAKGDDKGQVRKRVWDYLEKHGLVNFPRPCYNRIPNFKGANVACDKLTELDAYKKAKTIKVNPDKPQEQARFRILESKKTLLVPTPRLRSGLFNKITPPEGCGQDVLRKCATSQGVKEFSSPIGLDDQVKVDLVIIGSVAVSPKGWRIGKGEGFADLEYAMMYSKGSVNEHTYVVTAVHDCQVFDTLPDELFGAHDVTVDFIVTPTRVIEVKPRLAKPRGVIWSLLSREKFDQVPILKKLRYSQMREGVDVRLQDEMENGVSLVEIKEGVIQDGEKEIEMEDMSPRREKRQRPKRSNRKPRRSEGDSKAADNKDGNEGVNGGGDEAKKPPRRQRQRRPRNDRSRSEGDRKDNDEKSDRQVNGDAQGDGEEGDQRPRRQNRNRRNRRRKPVGSGDEGVSEGGDGDKETEGDTPDKDEANRARRRQRRNRQRNKRSENKEEGERSDVAAEDLGEDGGSPRPSPSRRRRRGKPQRRRESEHSTDGDAETPRESSPRQRRPRANKTPAVYIGAIPRKARVSEVKAVIRERDVNPLRVIWHSGAARTFLLFTSQEEAEKAVLALDGLTIMERAVRVELAKGSQRNGPDAGGDGPDVDGEGPAAGKEVQDDGKDKAGDGKKVSDADKATPDAGKDTAEAGKETSDAGKEIPDVGKDKADAVKDKAEPVKDVSDASKDKADAVKDKAEPVKDKAEPVKDKAEPVKDKAEPVKETSDAGKEIPDAGKDKADASKEASDASKDKADAVKEVAVPDVDKLAEEVSKVTVNGDK